MALDHWYCSHCDGLDCFLCFVAVERACAAEVDDQWEESAIDLNEV
jgi:hypothetical protein